MKYIIYLTLFVILFSSSLCVRFHKERSEHVHRHQAKIMNRNIKANAKNLIFTNYRFKAQDEELKLEQNPRIVARKVDQKHKQRSLFKYMTSYRFKAQEEMNAQDMGQLNSYLSSRVQSKSNAQLKTKLTDDGKTSYEQGWLKFLELKDGKELSVLKFFRNDAYSELQKRNHDHEAEDEQGNVEIPSQVSFFFILTNEGLFALRERRNSLTQTMKFFPLQSMKPILQGKKGLEGGCEDVGNFEEGFCFSVNASTADELQWICCADSLQEKEAWMDSIKAVKGLLTVFSSAQKLEGIASLGSSGSALTAPIQYSQTGPDGQTIRTDLTDEPPPSKDGQWKDLQDWSTCSLFCGGGTQTKHRQCIPGTDPEGKPCSGEPILVKPCNEQPCPPQDGAEEKEEELPLKVEIKRFSYRPARYETCIIKEGDLDIIRSDLTQFKIPPRVPTRVVLNNQTVSVFQTATNYDDMLFSCELKDLTLHNHETDNSCFQMICRGTYIVQLCSMSATQGQTLEQNRNEWVKQIGFFQANCNKPVPIQEPDMDIANIKKQEVEMEEEEAKQDAAAAGAAPGQPQQGGQAATANLAVDAMAKELKYEQLAEKEELDREVLEDLEQRKKKETMKAANECMERDERRAQAAMKENAAVGAAAKEAADMRGNIRNMIMNQRATASKKIATMKKMHDRQAKAGAGDIQEMRLTMAKKAMAAAKKGDIKNCDPKQAKEAKAKYCNKNFDTDPDMNADCKDPESFCNICCENEFGLKFVNERNACLAQCDAAGGGKAGNWVWVPEANAVKAF